ncbi:unnamed protein product [Allacma fusca]|uniref:Uncharacterized protein n=1 Tax=Allacma fusca TaxID=39272 RepID=A0A8J2J5Q4_9HEXA|nr:unnamed protein product [Allacma fusca]
MKGKKSKNIAVLSDKSLKWLKIGIIVPSAIGSIPYGWDEKTQKAYTIKESASSPKAVGTFYIMTSYWILMAGQYSVSKFYGEHHIWINNFLDFLKDIQQHQKHSLSKLSDGYTTCQNFLILVIFVFIADVWSCWTLPDAPFYISSMMPNPKILSKLELFPFVCLHIWIWAHQWSTMFFHVNTLVPYLVGLKNSLNILRFRIAEGTEELEYEPPNSSHAEMQTKSFGKYFRQMEVLNVVSNKLWSTANAILEISMLLGIICACYGTVRLDAARATQQGMIVILLTGTVIVLWGIMGELFETSMDVLYSWKAMKQNRWFRRFFKSCKPIRVNIGQGLFFADRGIKLTLLEIITTNVSSLLLSTSGSKGSLN